MTFHDKLRRLVQDMNKSAVARRAGISPQAIDSYVRLGNVPLIDSAVRLARALGVDIAWLIDDERDWPPVRVERETAGAAA